MSVRSPVQFILNRLKKLLGYFCPYFFYEPQTLANLCNPHALYYVLAFRAFLFSFQPFNFFIKIRFIVFILNHSVFVKFLLCF